MVQRILQPAEIESIDHIAVARLRLPQPGEVFASRAQRLRQRAEGNPIGPYLLLMAELAQAQHDVAAALVLPVPDEESLRRAHEYGMPPLGAASGDLTQVGGVLDALRIRLGQATVPEPVMQAMARLAALSPAALASQARALLVDDEPDVDAAAAPFLMAALQVIWTVEAGRLAERDVPPLDVPGVCPVCGTPPVASIVRIGGQYQGLRYLHCSLCATEWHMVRVKCSHCESTDGIAYYVVEGGDESVKAESCEQCHSYRKICYMEKDPLVEPLADDLASLPLDLLMGEAGYARATGNPLLWQMQEAPTDGR